MLCRIQNDIAPWSMVKSTLAAPAVILNADFAVSVPLPLSPHIHAVGALNSAPAQALPADLERLFQASLPYGVVYVSMGSVAIPGAASIFGVACAAARLHVSCSNAAGVHALARAIVGSIGACAFQRMQSSMLRVVRGRFVCRGSRIACH